MDKMLRIAILMFALAIALMLIAGGQDVFGQTYGAEIPWTQLTFANSSGFIIPGGKLCSYVAGTTTPQDTYTTSDISGTGVKNTNPIVMNSAGRPTSNGIYLIAAKYKFVLRTAGTDATCSTGTVVWTQDDVFDIGQLIAAGLVTINSINNRQFCVTGANFGAKFTAATALLPSTGGIVDCSNLQGPQTIASDVFTGVSKPILLIWPTGTATATANLTIPTTMTVDFPEGGILSLNSMTTATINGEVRGTLSQHFAGAGSVSVTSAKVPVIYPEWFGAVGDGTANDTTAIQAAVNALPTGHGIVRFLCKTYLISSVITFNAGGVVAQGCGQASTTIKFAPTATATAFQFTANGAAISQNAVRGMTFDATGETAHVKTAIDLVDIEEVEISDIAVSNWSDATKASIGIQLAGRQASLFARLTMNADQPFHVKIDPNTAVVACDHIVFRDIYAIADQTQPVFKIDTGVFLTNVTWDGYQAWVKGTYGIYWNDTTATKESYEVHISNARWEQSTNATGYMLYLAPNYFSYGLQVKGVYSDSNHKGFYIRNFRSGQVSSNFTELLSEAINVDSSDGITVSDNFFNINAGATVTTTGFVGDWFNNDASGSNIATGRAGFGVPNPTNQVVIPNNAFYSALTSAGAEKQLMGLDNSGNNNLLIGQGITQTFIGSTSAATLGIGGAFGHTDTLSIPNAKYYGGQKTDNSDDIAIAGVDALNQVVIAPNSTVTYTNSPSFSFGGAIGSGRSFYTGIGGPNGSVIGYVGDLYININGGASTTLYVKESGTGTNTGWIGK